MMRKTFLLLIMVALPMFIAQASSWDKDTKRLYRHTKVIRMQVDFSKATIIGRDSAECAQYLAEETRHCEKYLGDILKTFRSILAKEASEKSGKNFVLDGDTEFVFDIQINNVSEKAEIGGVARLFQKDNPDKAVEYKIKIKEGRWNSFENLLKEAAENLGKAIKCEFNHSCIYEYKPQNILWVVKK